MKPGSPVPFCAGRPPVADAVALLTPELAGLELSKTELAATELVGAELGVIVLGAKKATVVVSSSGE